MKRRIPILPSARLAVGLILSLLSLSAAQASVPVIESLTRDQAPRLGDRVVLETVVTADPPATLSWFHSSVLVGNGPQMILNSITPDHLGSYQVVAQNSSGSVTSAPVFLVARPERLVLTESPHSLQRVKRDAR